MQPLEDDKNTDSTHNSVIFAAFKFDTNRKLVIHDANR